GDHRQAAFARDRAAGRRQPRRHERGIRPGESLRARHGRQQPHVASGSHLRRRQQPDRAPPNGQEVPAYTLLLTALETQSDVDVLSAPNMVTTDNEEAEIVVGRNVPFVASRATSSSNLSNLFTTIERRDVGITLRLTPRITADDFVHLTLFEEVSDIDPI